MNAKRAEEDGVKKAEKSFKDFNLARSYDITRILMVFSLRLFSSLMMAGRLHSTDEVMGESDFNLLTQRTARDELMNDRTTMLKSRPRKESKNKRSISLKCQILKIKLTAETTFDDFFSFI